MRLDPTLAAIISEVFKDIGKAYFIGAIVTPQVSRISNLPEILFVLTRGLYSGSVCILIAWYIIKRWGKRR